MPTIRRMSNTRFKIFEIEFRSVADHQHQFGLVHGGWRWCEWCQLLIVKLFRHYAKLCTLWFLILILVWCWPPTTFDPSTAIYVLLWNIDALRLIPWLDSINMFWIIDNHGFMHTLSMWVRMLYVVPLFTLGWDLNLVLLFSLDWWLENRIITFSLNLITIEFDPVACLIITCSSTWYHPTSHCIFPKHITYENKG